MALQEEKLHIEQVCINDILEQSLVGFYGVFTKKDIKVIFENSQKE